MHPASQLKVTIENTSTSSLEFVKHLPRFVIASAPSPRVQAQTYHGPPTVHCARMLPAQQKYSFITLYTVYSGHFVSKCAYLQGWLETRNRDVCPKVVAF